MAKQGKAPPEIQKSESSSTEIGPDWLWIKNPAGILLPADSSTSTYATTTWGKPDIGQFKEIKATADNIKKSLVEYYEYIFGYPIAVGNSWDKNYGYPPTPPHSGQYDISHAVLRGYHGRRYEYVWSDTLQAHVRIGESLKEKS